MQSSRFSVKFYVQNPAGLELEAFVPLFHSFIQKQTLENHLLIDVADYKHVKSGPGVVLVSHEANISMDATDGRLGLMYQRKTPIEGDVGERLRQVFAAACSICRQIEGAPVFAGKLKFRTGDAVVRIHDRLFAPNTPEVYAQIRPELERFVNRVFGEKVGLTHLADEETLFTVRISAAGSPGVEELLKRL